MPPRALATLMILTGALLTGCASDGPDNFSSPPPAPTSGAQAPMVPPDETAPLTGGVLFNGN